MVRHIKFCFCRCSAPPKLQVSQNCRGFWVFCWPETLGREKLSAEKFLKLSAESLRPRVLWHNSRLRVFKTLIWENTKYLKSLGREFWKFSAEKFSRLFFSAEKLKNPPEFYLMPKSVSQLRVFALHSMIYSNLMFTFHKCLTCIKIGDCWSNLSH